MALATGSRLGPYEVVSALGAGGMGEVYRARDTRLDRIVAIKVLREALSVDPQFRERFDREARTISQLDHPHICALYDVGEQDGTSFLVMQYLEGETLADRLTKGALPLDQALRIAIDVAGALDKAHHAGIVHRDLKPGNIMLTRAGAKLLDFGLAKTGTSVVAAAGLSMLPTTPPNLTARGTILGTFQYMAPEQLEGDEADARTDIFAFSAVLYEMVTGKKAFEGKTQASLIAAILEREPTPVTSLQPLVPRTLDRVIRRGLSKDPDQRWQSALDLAIQLQWVAETGPEAAVRRTSFGGRPRLWWSIGLGLLLLALAGWGGLLLQLGRGAAPLPAEPVVFAITPPEGATFVTPPSLFGLPWLALSPDGRALAFVALSADGRQQLWTRPLAGAVATPLAGTDDARVPFWSPDSRYIAFFGRGKLKYVDAAGGTPQIISDAPGYAGGGSWNRENTIIFAPTPQNDGLRKVQVGTGDAIQPVTRIDRGQGQEGHVWPQFLPDGRHFLFGVVKFSSGGAETWIGSLDGGEPRLLVRADAVARYAEPGYLLFKRGPLLAQRVDARDFRLVGDPIRVTDAVVGSNTPSTYLALSTSTTGTFAYGRAPAGETQLVWRDRTGRMLGSISLTNSSAPSVSRDGTTLVLSRNLPQTGTDLWLYDLKRNAPMRFTFESSTSPIWSPDGKYVAYSANREGGINRLYRKLATGLGPEELLFKTGAAYPTDWSADGRFILFNNSNRDQRNGMDLLFLSVANLQVKPVMQTLFNEAQGALSPDGRWVAYASDESSVFEVYVQAFPDGAAKRVVSSGGGAEPRWRADGRELFYVSADRRLMTVPTTIGPTFDAKKPAALFEMNIRDLVYPYLRRYEVTPDGQRFVAQELTVRSGPSPLTVVVNWPALLPKAH
jgi:Tol biopolymer transport system component/predicted Ser/Thr protein kinase